VLGTWFTFDWGTPYYWDYGPGEYINCYNNVVYVNGRWFEPAPVYYQRTVVLAQSAPDLTPEQAVQIEWLPMGVFAVSREGVVDNNLLVQLAVTKDGVIGGTVHNQATGESFDIEGTVDKQSQRAVWTYVDENNNRIAMETSIYNLTQPESTALVHNGPEDMQVVELVRLDAPAEDPAANAEAAGAAAPEAANGVLPPPAGEPAANAVARPVVPPAARDQSAPALDAAPAPAADPIKAPEPAPVLPPKPTNPVTPIDNK
jgi:hypothetical protein